MSDEVPAVLILLETRKGHLRTRDVLLRVLEVLEEGLVVPDDPLVHVRGGVRVAIGLTCLTAEDAVDSRVRTGRLDREEGELTRRGSVRPCAGRPSRGCGTVHSGS